MNKKNEKIESKDDLKAKLLKHLEKTGYPLELQVGGILSQYGWTVEHNRYYIDEDEQKGREIDITAIRYSNSRKYNLRVGACLICEVKQSPKNPWIVLSTRRTGFEAEGILRLCCQSGQGTFNLLSGIEVETRSTTSQFTRIGRSYYEGFKSPNAKSIIFEALTKAVKASEYWLKKEEEAIKKDEATLGKNKRDFREITFVDSIIALEGLLYEAYLNVDNHLELLEIQHIPVSFGYVSNQYNRIDYLVEIVTINELPNLLLNKQKWIAHVRNTMITKLRKLLK